jgi:hypothetical protein
MCAQNSKLQNYSSFYFYTYTFHPHHIYFKTKTLSNIESLTFYHPCKQQTKKKIIDNLFIQMK